MTDRGKDLAILVLADLILTGDCSVLGYPRFLIDEAAKVLEPFNVILVEDNFEVRT